MTNIHQNFDMTFMAGRMSEAFQKIETTCTMGITQALNVISGATVEPTFAADTLTRVDFLIGQLEYLKTRRSELAELIEEANMEAGQ